MEPKIFYNETDGEVIQLDGRRVTWLLKVAAADTKYTSVCLVAYEPGRRAKPSHSHPYGEETIYILSGTGKAKVGDQISKIEPGMLVRFPQGIQHMLWNTGDVDLVAVCFYAPNAEAIDYQFDADFDFPEFMIT